MNVQDNYIDLIHYLESLVNSEKWEKCLDTASSYRGEISDDRQQARIDLFEGIACVMTGKKGRGKALLEKAHRFPSAESFNYLGIYYFLGEKYEEALPMFEKAVSVDQTYYDAWFNLADTCEELGLKEKEKTARDKLKSLTPS